MAWEDRTPFEAIKTQFGLDEASVIALLRQQLTPGALRPWRDRVHGRKTKHAIMRLVALKGAISSRRAIEHRSARKTLIN